MQLKGRRAAGVPEEARLAGGEIVVTGDVVAFPQQAVYGVAADKAGGAGDEDPHSWFKGAGALASSSRYRLRRRRMRKISLTLRRLPATSSRRLSPSSRQRMGTSLI